MILQILSEAKEFNINDRESMKEIFKLIKKLKNANQYDWKVNTGDIEEAAKVAKKNGYNLYPKDEQFAAVDLMKRFFTSAYVYNLVNTLIFKSVQLTTSVNPKNNKEKAYGFVLMTGIKTKGKIFLAFKGKKGETVGLIYKDGDELKMLD